MSTLKCVKLKKNLRWLRDINPRASSWWAGRRDLKNIFSVGFPRGSAVNERYIRHYGWIKIQSWT